MKKLIIVALFTSGVWAGNQPTFSEFDLNNDGKITKIEFDEARTQRMKQRADDGRMQRNAGERHSFKQIDINKNGFISKEEFILHGKMHQNQSCLTWQNSAL